MRVIKQIYELALAWFFFLPKLTFCPVSTSICCLKRLGPIAKHEWAIQYDES
jgi:hypothetical protein